MANKREGLVGEMTDYIGRVVRHMDDMGMLTRDDEWIRTQGQELLRRARRLKAAARAVPGETVGDGENEAVG